MFIRSSIYAFSKYLLSAYYVAGIVLGSGDILVKGVFTIKLVGDVCFYIECWRTLWRIRREGHLQCQQVWGDISGWTKKTSLRRQHLNTSTLRMEAGIREEWMPSEFASSSWTAFQTWFPGLFFEPKKIPRMESWQGSPSPAKKSQGWWNLASASWGGS